MEEPEAHAGMFGVGERSGSRLAATVAAAQGCARVWAENAGSLPLWAPSEPGAWAMGAIATRGAHSSAAQAI